MIKHQNVKENIVIYLKYFTISFIILNIVALFQTTFIYKDLQLHFLIIPNILAIVIGYILANLKIAQNEKEKALIEKKQATNRLKEIAKISNDWIWEVDAHGRYTYVSERIKKFLGYEAEDVIGKTPFDLMDEEEAVRVSEMFDEIVAKKKSFENLENWNLTKDGRRICLLKNGIPILDAEGNLLGYRGADQDITERKLAEENLKKLKEALEYSNRELEDFAYISSHDLQEPLRKVRAFGDRLKTKYKEVLDDTGKDYLDRMQDASERMQALIDDLLTYSRVSTKKKPFTPVELKDIVDGVISDLKITINETKARITCSDLPCINADDSQIRQLFQNLIGNAIKFRNEDIVPLIKIDAAPRQNGFIEITVKDNGIGFDIENSEKIFAPFHRLHGRNKYIGSGIGLAICKKIVERHGGKISAKSKKGEGACFTLELPAAKKN